MKRIFVLFAFFFASIVLQAELPVIGDWSDIKWWGGNSWIHRTVTFHPNSKYVVGSYGRTEIFSIEDSVKFFREYPGTNPIFSRSGKYLGYISEVGVGKFEIRVIDYEADTIKCKISRTNDDPFDILPDERTVAVGGLNVITLYDIETGENVQEKVVSNDWNSVVEMLRYIPGRKQIFFVRMWPVYKGVEYGEYIWDLETDSIKPTNWRAPIAISYDGRYLSYAGKGNEDGRVATVIDLTTGEEVGYVPPPFDFVSPNDLALDPSNRYLVFLIKKIPTHVDPYQIFIWDLLLKEIVYVMPDTTLEAYSCKFSPDGKYLAIGFSIFLLDFERIKRKIEEATGVAEPEHAFFVYYNPYQVDYIRFHYRLEELIPTTITVHDVFGRKVAEEECGWWLYTHNGEYGIPASYFPSGVYFVTIASGGKIVTQKFVVVH